MVDDNKKKITDDKKKITDESINNILYKLTILSYIKQGEKLYCDSNNNIVIDESYWQSISRYFANQNRNNTTEAIKDLINDSIEITDFIYRCELSVRKNIKEKEQRQQKTFFKNSNEKILKQFYIKMTNAIDGLSNLKLTYHSDITIKTDLELLINKLTNRIQKIEEILIIAI